MIGHQCSQAPGDGVVKILGGLLRSRRVRVDLELSVRYLGSSAILHDERGARPQTPEICEKGSASAVISEGDPGAHGVIVDLAAGETSLVDGPDVAPENDPAVVATKEQRTDAQDVGDKGKPAFPRLVNNDDEGAEELPEARVLLGGDDG